MELTQIKKVDILSILQYLGLDRLRKVGDNYAMLCPIHSEKTPSCIVFPRTNTWKCFGCNAGGSNIDFVMSVKQLDFSESVNLISRLFNLGEIEKNVVLLPEQKDVKNNGIIDKEWIEYCWQSLATSKEKEYFINRGFTEETINKLGFGWDGERYVIPIWKNEPWKSNCTGVRLRASKYLDSDTAKYIGKKGYNNSGIYNVHTTKDKDFSFVFAGELDSALAYQDNLPSFSLVNGMNFFHTFPKSWPILWLPKVKKLYIIFDRKEAHKGGILAESWERYKGRNSSFVLHWPLGDYDDYGEFRSKNRLNYFLDFCYEQLNTLKPGEGTWLYHWWNTRN